MERGRFARWGTTAIVLWVVTSASPARAASSESRYSLAGGCFTLAAGPGSLGKAGDGYAAGAGSPEPFRVQATDLGKYLLYGRERDFLAAGDGNAIEVATDPSRTAEWVIEGSKGRFRLINLSTGRGLDVGPGGSAVQGDPTTFAVAPAEGCSTFPELEINATGKPFRGTPRYGKTSGLIDLHNHMMAFEFLGGSLHCGRPWHRYGVAHALVDCPDHAANGPGAVLENFFATGTPVGTHDNHGWPTFEGWPRWDSLTHEGVYYRWLERAWRGGLRVFVNLMVDNAVVCEVYPLKRNSCSELESARLQIRRTYELQDFIDAQSGGPGKGWFRIVRNPFQARRVINAGKLAVVLGIEEAKPFDCGLTNGVPDCTREEVDALLGEAYRLGIRQMELLNQFDNSFGGVAGQSGPLGVVANTGNQYETGRFIDYQTCTGPPDVSDKPQPTGHELFGATLSLFLPPGTAPVYPEPPHCNSYGLSDIGAHTIRRMMDKGMIIDPDHMSVLARDATLDLIQAHDYGGVVSSHSWSDRIAYARILELGGIVTPIADPADDMVEKWRELRKERNPRYLFGFGYGSDTNGISSSAERRRDGPPVEYPFRAFDGGTTLRRQVSGTRVYDINQDGVAHYGLFPDWIEDMRNLGGRRITKDLGRGAEAYLQMWERAAGIPGPRCRRRHRHVDPRGSGDVRLGLRPRQLLRRAGQPQRRGRAWRYCVRSRRGRRAKLVAVFAPRRTVGIVVTDSRGHSVGDVRVGTRIDRLPDHAVAIGGGLWARDAGTSGRRFVYVVRGGRVRAAGVAARSIAARRSRLVKALRIARLGGG